MSLHTIPTLDHYLQLGSWFAGTPDDLVAHLKSLIDDHRNQWNGARHTDGEPL
jgi:hypothetical protein